MINVINIHYQTDAYILFVCLQPSYFLHSLSHAFISFDHPSLFPAAVGRHHQVAVWRQVLDAWGLAADGGRLPLHTGDLEHPTWVVFQQVALKGLPAPTNAHHHVLVVQHLQKEAGLKCSL